MKLIDRYLIREVAPYFLMGFVLLTSMIFLHEVGRFSELFIVFSRYGLPTGPLFRLLGSILPGIVVYTIPVSLLLGVLMGLGRLSSDSEVTALRASGVGRVRILVPLLALGLVVAGAMLYLTAELAPISKKTLSSLKETKGSIAFQGISTQIKPRVFEESVPGKVFYIQDIERKDNTWRNIFIADVSGNPEEPGVYTARLGRLTSPPTEDSLPELHLEGVQSHTVRNTRVRNKLEYTVSDSQHAAITFETPGGRAAAPVVREGPPDVEAMPLDELLVYSPAADDAGQKQFEIHRRLALPVTAIVFVVIGLAFGVSNQRAGRSFGLLVGLLLTTAFYMLSLGGEQSARKGAIPLWLGAWGPNLVFLLVGVAGMLGRNTWARALFSRGLRQRAAAAGEGPKPMATPAADERGQRVWSGFPRIIDRLIVSDLGRQLLLATLGMTAVFLVVTLFELVGSIVVNRIPAAIVLAYVTYLTPQILSYLTPLATLVAVMATFGLLASGSQVIALKASGQSIYRLSAPVFAVALLLSGGLFLLQNYVLPVTNRQHQDLRQLIRSGQEPVRTVRQLDRHWVFGRQSRIFYFRHYDATQKSFASLTVFDLDPQTFQVTQRIFAETARWDEDAKAWQLGLGWFRTFEGGRVTGGRGFKSRTLPADQVTEGPDWFSRSAGEADVMTVGELRREIAELSQSGFDVLDLRIELQRKLAAPLACLVMALVGLPFAFSVGKRGALFGVAVGLGIGLLFWGAIGLFMQMGRYEMLPPALAAWGPNLLFGASGGYLLMTART